jgi:hypothetical protein
VTQGPQERRLGRLASAMNQKARKVGAIGQVTAIDLAIIARDHPRCAYCSIGLEPDQGSFDHVTPFDRGGRNEPANIVRTCFTCNRIKFTKTPDELAEYMDIVQVCPIDGTEFRPRWAEYRAGRGRFCSRSCAAKSRWV